MIAVITIITDNGARIAQSVYPLVKGWTVRGSNPGGGEIFDPSRPALGLSQPPCTMGTGSFAGVKGPRRGLDHSPPSSAEVKERA